MNCQIFETVLNDLAREQMMEANAREQALAHSDNCEACALRLSLERRLTSDLRALAAEMKSVSAPARVEEQLQAAFRCQTSLLPQMRPASRSRYWLLAAAAVVLIGFGMAGVRLGLDGHSPLTIETSRNTEAPTSKTPAIMPAIMPATIIEPAKTKRVAKLASGLHRPKRQQVVRSSKQPSSDRTEASMAGGPVAEVKTTGRGSEDIEVTTQFLPLSYTSLVSLQEGGQLVRVEMPRSAMVSFGLPVNMERYGEKVKADVLVSADGLARAIRFVQ